VLFWPRLKRAAKQIFIESIGGAAIERFFVSNQFGQELKILINEEF
jgi:hypothetical protein